MARALRALTFLEALLFSGLVAMFIWRWQAAAPHSWIVLPAWLLVSFLLHRDTPKTLGWRADNFWPATRQGLWMFAAFIAAILTAGIALGAVRRTPQHVLDRHRFIGYFAFCLLQQVAVNSYLMNRFLFATSTSRVPTSIPAGDTNDQKGPIVAALSNPTSDADWKEHSIVAAALSSLVFGALHWPNPVLVPVTLIGGFGMCLLFAKQRNILPLTLGQAILGGLTWWAFPVAWHHSMRVGPGYYSFAQRLVHW
ncbi:MAG TPA: CPBP family intramembrane glutamic endopeptidase [Candidatus Acidoferrum sp.]